jgi:hypothetical protein
MKTRKALLSLAFIVCCILLTPFYGSAQTESTTGFKDLLNPDTIFNYVWLGMAIAFFLSVLWVLTSAMGNLSDVLKKRTTTSTN